MKQRSLPLLVSLTLASFLPACTNVTSSTGVNYDVLPVEYIANDGPRCIYACVSMLQTYTNYYKTNTQKILSIREIQNKHADNSIGGVAKWIGEEIRYFGLYNEKYSSVMKEINKRLYPYNGYSHYNKQYGDPSIVAVKGSDYRNIGTSYNHAVVITGMYFDNNTETPTNVGVLNPNHAPQSQYYRYLSYDVAKNRWREWCEAQSYDMSNSIGMSYAYMPNAPYSTSMLPGTISGATLAY